MGWARKSCTASFVARRFRQRLAGFRTALGKARSRAAHFRKTTLGWFAPARQNHPGYAEQGLGDTIQFARYLPLVQRRGGKVVFECPPALIGLFTGFVGIDQIVSTDSILPTFHENIPLMSLPGLFRTTLATIPADIPYLDAERLNDLHWRRMMNETASVTVRSSVNIGIAWQGNPTHGHDRSAHSVETI